MNTNTNFLLPLFSVALILSSVSHARSSGGSWRPRKIELTPISWVGSLRCEEKLHEPKHQKDHECDLEFVEDQTGDTWSVKMEPELLKLHQNYNGPVRAKIDGLSSPKFLFGGGYVKVNKIDVKIDAGVVEGSKAN